MTCEASFCYRVPPEGYQYCDDHHLLRDREDDEPGDMPRVRDKRRREGGR